MRSVCQEPAMACSLIRSDGTDRAMIFIVGNSRSGTTMLGRMLGLHSRVHTFGELHFFEQLVHAEDLQPGVAWPRDRARLLVERLLTRIRNGFFAAFHPGRYHKDAEAVLDTARSLAPAALYAAVLQQEALAAGKPIPCEQTPRYLFFAEEILATFPEARIVNMIRDPRDVLLSQRSKWKRRFLGGSVIPVREALRAWSNFHPWLVSRLWVSSVDRAAKLEGDRFTSLRFEDLLQAPERELRRLCDFLGLEPDPRMLEVPQIGSSAGQDAPEKRGLNPDRAGGWRKSGMAPAQRALCEWVCHDRMRRVGYGDFLHDGRFTPAVLPLLLILPAKLALALAFNLRRFPRLFASLRRRFGGAPGAT